MHTEQQALERLKGKMVESIQHDDVIGNVHIHFTDGSAIQIFAQEKANQQVTIFEPNKKVVTHNNICGFLGKEHPEIHHLADRKP